MSISGLLSGSVQGSLGISAGAAIAVGTNIERVAAHITGATVEVGRDLRLDADLLMVQGNLAVGGSLADSFALWGSIAVNTAVDTTEAYISASHVSVANDISLEAGNTSVIGVVSGSGQGAKTAAAGAALAVNTIWDTLSTRIEEGSTVSAGGNLSLDAEKITVIGSVVVSGRLAKDFTLGGSFGINAITNTTEAVIVGSTVAAGGALDLSARDLSVIGSLVGSVSGSLGVSAGMAVSVNLVTNTIRAGADESDLSVGGAIDMQARNLSVTGNMAISGVAGQYFALGGSAAANRIDNSTESYIKGTTTPLIEAGGGISLSAFDHSVNGVFRKICGSSSTPQEGIADEPD